MKVTNKKRWKMQFPFNTFNKKKTIETDCKICFLPYHKTRWKTEYSYYATFLAHAVHKRKNELSNFKRQAWLPRTLRSARGCDYSRRKWGHWLVMTFTKRPACS